MENIIKIDENTIEVTKTEEVKTVYNIDFLKSQRLAIQKQKDEDNEKRDAELKKIDDLLSASEKL